jgi:hypothetical protein
MARCKANAQFFFIDACRQVSADLLEFDGLHVLPLIDPRLRGLNNRRDAPILYAAAREEKAFAPRDRTSRFTEALLQALQGNGARRSEGAWRVSNISLPEAVLQRMRRGSGGDVPVQVPRLDGESAGTSYIHVLPGPPAVPAFVTVEHPYPPTTRLVFRRGTVASAHAAGPGPWSLEVPAGVYDEVVAVDGDVALGRTEDGWVVPPEYTESIR